MNVFYICFFPTLLMFILIYTESNRAKKRKIIRQIIDKKRNGAKSKMIELAKQFIGKDCIIYTLNNQIFGTVKEVSNGALMIENNEGNVELVNLDYIIRLRDYPRKKNGKKKSIILD